MQNGDLDGRRFCLRWRTDYVAGTCSRNDALAASNHACSLSAVSDGRCRPSLDRKSTRLNSSHITISYAVFCLKKKKKKKNNTQKKKKKKKKKTRKKKKKK